MKTIEERLLPFAGGMSTSQFRALVCAVKALNDAELKEDDPLGKIWSCKIGPVPSAELPPGSDLPMRIAVQQAFHALLGRDARFLFSGWRTHLTEGQRNLVLYERGKGRHE